MDIKKDYRVKLENIFEGPMDLLIYLIKKNEVDIYDIPVKLITEQYLVYLEWIQLLNIDNVGDFLLMASTLAQIKSKTLLPIHDDEDEEDPRMEIVRPLSEYLQMKSAAEQLACRNILGDTMFARRAKLDGYISKNQGRIQAGLFELIDAFQNILNRAVKDHTVDMAAETISVKDRMNSLIEALESKGSLVFTELFEDNPEKKFIIATFLALLELMKINLIRIVQNSQNGIIRLFYQ
ncbi:MAG: segregation/condensation protein A [Desulfobacteraceae bacterium]|nr:segregation/condensation protein A [Desulfobacteraceae bacterium]